jgi:hypothetical protein
MISSVYERKNEIGIYTSVGLAPSHVGFLFVAEAMALAVISVVLGYLLAQVRRHFSPAPPSGRASPSTTPPPPVWRQCFWSLPWC